LAPRKFLIRVNSFDGELASSTLKMLIVVAPQPHYQSLRKAIHTEAEAKDKEKEGERPIKPVRHSDRNRHSEIERYINSNSNSNSSINDRNFVVGYNKVFVEYCDI